MNIALAFLYLRSKIAGIAGWAIKNPSWALAVLFGLSTLWFWHGDHTKGEYITRFMAAQKAEAVLEKKDVAQTAAAQVVLNTKVEKTYEQGIVDGRASLAGWMRDHSAPSGASSAAQDHAAVVPATSGPTSPTVALTEAQLILWDQTYQDDQSCRMWASGIAKMFDGNHWPTSNEVDGVLSATSQSNTDTAKP